MTGDLSWLELEVGWVFVSASLEVNLSFEVSRVVLSEQASWLGILFWLDFWDFGAKIRILELYKAKIRIYWDKNGEILPK